MNELPQTISHNVAVFDGFASCRSLWASALSLYLEDVEQAVAGSRGPHQRSALADFETTKTQLERLCDHLEVDADAVAWRVLDKLTRPAVVKA